MAVLAAFGDDANFVLSVGGFHPRLRPAAAAVPVAAADRDQHPQRGLARSCAPRRYFAVTTNTAQFGARVELCFGFSDFGIEGSFGFDALFQFSPFAFRRRHLGVVLGEGVRRRRVQRPARARARGPDAVAGEGHGSISLLFFDIGVDFDITWGERAGHRPAADRGHAALLERARQAGGLDGAASRRARTCSSRCAPSSPPRRLVLHPVGTLRVSQRAVPLDLTSTKVGDADARPTSTQLTVGVADGALAKRADVLRVVRARAVPGLRRRDEALQARLRGLHGGIELSVAGDQLASGDDASSASSATS